MEFILKDTVHGVTTEAIMVTTAERKDVDEKSEF